MKKRTRWRENFLPCFHLAYLFRRKNRDENSERKCAWVFAGDSRLSWRSFGANSQFPQTKNGAGESHWADRKRKDHDALHHARYFEQAGVEYFNRRRSD